MGVITSIQQLFKVLTQQLTDGGFTTPPGIYFTKNFYAKAKEWKLTEKDAEDVYYHGQEIKPHMMVRKFNGYEIGIYYFLDKQTAKPVISSIWKQQ